MSYYSPAVPSLRVDFGVVLLVLLVVVTGVKQGQLLVIGLKMEFDNNKRAKEQKKKKVRKSVQ